MPKKIKKHTKKQLHRFRSQHVKDQRRKKKTRERLQSKLDDTRVDDMLRGVRDV